MARTTYGRPARPLGVCNHCGRIGRIWEYGADEPGRQKYICYECIEAVIDQPSPPKKDRKRRYGDWNDRSVDQPKAD